MNYYPGTPLTENDNEAATHVSLWHRFRPKAADGHTSFLFWLTVLALGSVSLLSVTWIASAALAKKGSEKLLRVDLLLPKLKSIHGERKAPAFRMSEPEPSALAPPKERKTSAPAHLLPAVIDHPTGTTVELPHHGEIPAATLEPPAFVSSDPGFNLIPPLIVPPPMIETCYDPVVFLQQCTSPRGDSPMIRNWKTLTMYSLLSAAAVALAPTPPIVFAEEKKIPAKVVDDKAMQELADRIATLENKKLTIAEKDALAQVLRAELKKLEDGALADINQDLKAVKKGVSELTTELSALKAEQLRQKIQIDNQKYLIEQLTKRLDAGPTTPTVDKTMLEILKDIKDGIAKLGPTNERKMMSPPNGTAATMGRVMLVNLYTEDLLVLINGKAFRVPAGKTRPVDDVPAGNLQFQVHSERWGTFDNRNTNLLPGETFTLTATPQR
jgi:hypothetical protein